MNRLIFILLIICIWNSSCKSQSNRKENIINLPITHKYELKRAYNDSIIKFSLCFPNNWKVTPYSKNKGLMGAGPLLNYENETMKRDGAFSASFSKLGKEYSAEIWLAGNMKSVKKDFPDFKIIELAEIDIDGIIGIYICFSLTINGVQVTNVQVYFTKGSIGYILTGSASSYKFKDYRDLYIEIARTFKFIS